MVGTRKRKGWGDDNDSSVPPSSKISRDQLLLSDCLENINSETADLTSVDNTLMRDHKRDSGELSTFLVELQYNYEWFFEQYGNRMTEEVPVGYICFVTKWNCVMNYLNKTK